MSGARVPGWGRMDSKLILVGEAPGPREEAVGEPFVGPSYHQKLRVWWEAVGLHRRDFRIENVCEFRPPGNRADAWDQPTWESWMEDLHQRLANLEDPYLIVPTGNYSLYALTGKGNVHWHKADGKTSRPGITDWRGSILSYRDRRGRLIKVIPTIHPAATFRTSSYEALCRRDWARIAEERHSKALNLPVRTHYISPSIHDIEDYLADCRREGEQLRLVVDIENPLEKKGPPLVAPIVCVGFSKDPAVSLTIPTTKSYWKDEDKLGLVWALIDELAQLCCSAHNVFHERYWLLVERKLELPNLIWDTMLMHHALDPTSEHRLDFCASVDTREPFWKHEAKDPEDQRKYTSNMAAFLTYNGKDCCVQRELLDLYYSRLEAQTRETSDGQQINGLDWYWEQYAEMLGPLFRLAHTGIAIDDAQRVRRKHELAAELDQIKAHIQAYGVDLFAKKKLSGKKVKAWLYDTLKFPQQLRKRSTHEKTVSSDALAIRKLLSHHQAAPLVSPEVRAARRHFEAVAPLLLRSERVAKLREFYDDKRISADGRFRSSYNLNTKEGRLNSKAYYDGSGSNGQNVDRESRDMFMADPGCIGLQVDGSQAEGRVCLAWMYHLTGKEQLIVEANARPDIYDMHTDNARRILKKQEITKAERYFAKTVVHGAQRMMQGQTMSDNAAKRGIVLDPAECDKAIAAYRSVVPLDEFFAWVKRDVQRNKVLYDTWGGRYDFSHERMDDATFREACSTRMQPEVARWMNQWGFKPLMALFEEHPDWGRLNVHVHDGVFISVIPARAYDVAKFLVEHLERPRLYGKAELTIPCEVAIGKRWKADREFKVLPSREVFDVAVTELTRKES